MIYNWSNKKILIAEDDDMNFMFLEEMLSDTNIGIYRAKNGKEVVELFQKNTDIDIILMDIKLKGDMDGIKAAMRIKLHFPRKQGSI